MLPYDEALKVWAKQWLPDDASVTSVDLVKADREEHDYGRVDPEHWRVEIEFRHPDGEWGWDHEDLYHYSVVEITYEILAAGMEGGQP